MKFNFWKRTLDEHGTPSDGEVALAAASRRLDAAHNQLHEARDVRRRSERTREINHWSEMMESAWAVQGWRHRSE